MSSYRRRWAEELGCSEHLENVLLTEIKKPTAEMGAHGVAGVGEVRWWLRKQFVAKGIYAENDEELSFAVGERIKEGD